MSIMYVCFYVSDRSKVGADRYRDDLQLPQSQVVTEERGKGWGEVRVSHATLLVSHPTATTFR